MIRRLIQITVLTPVLLFFISELSPLLIFADTIILNNGTLLVGKVKEEKASMILFKNYYGKFNISREQIKQLYKTTSYQEDIDIRKKMGKDFDEEEIRKNYEAGLKKIETDPEIAPKKKKPVWGGGSLFLSGAFYYVLGDLNDPIPYGYGGFLSYDQGPDYLTGGTGRPWIPGFRIEGGYLYFKKGDERLSSISLSAGPLWRFHLKRGKWGIISFSLQPGISLLTIEDTNESRNSNTFTMQSTLGYEYPLGRVSLLLLARHMYVYDRDVLFHSAGVSAGVAFRIW